MVILPKVSEKQELLTSALPASTWGCERSCLENEWIFPNGKQQRVDECSKEHNGGSLLACVPPGSLMKCSVHPKLWTYIVSQCFLKGDIHTAPDIPSNKHGHFVSTHDARGCPRLHFGAWELTCGLEHCVPPLGHRFCFQENSSNPLHSPNPAPLLLFNKHF